MKITKAEKTQLCKLYLLFGRSHFMSMHRHRKFLYHAKITTRTLKSLSKKGLISDENFIYCKSNHWLRFVNYHKISENVIFPLVPKVVKENSDPLNLFWNKINGHSGTVLNERAIEFEKNLLIHSPFLFTKFQSENYLRWDDDFNNLLNYLIEGMETRESFSFVNCT